MDFIESKKNKLRIRIPYEKYTTSSDDIFHLITNFQIHLKSGGYNAYVQSFAVFYSEAEIDNTKFQLLTKRFMKIDKKGNLTSATKLKVRHEEEDIKSGIKIVEFDVSNTKSIER